MSEKPKPNSEDSKKVMIRLPNGDYASLFEQLERQAKSEAEISMVLLKEGDLLAMQYEKTDKTSAGFTFEVTDMSWHDMGVSANGHPAPTVTGRLYGSELPEQALKSPVIFAGSGWGGSMFTPDVITTGCSPNFIIGKSGKSFTAPTINNFEVFRRDNKDELTPLEPYQLEAELKKEGMSNLGRLQKISKLMELFGFSEFDFKDATRASYASGQDAASEKTPKRAPLRYEHERYIVDFNAGKAMGNRLAVYDKKSAAWTEFKYFNYKGEDMLQVAFAELAGQDLDDLYMSRNVANEPGVHAAGVAITTYTTSARYGIDTLNYKPSDQECIELLKVPAPKQDEYQDIMQPNIIISADGVVTIPIVWPLTHLEETQPGLISRMQSMIKADVVSSGKVNLSIGSHEIKLFSPDEELDSLIEYLTSPKKVSRVRAGKLLGRVIRGFGDH